MNCFGKLSRDDGQSRVPAPPHMMTGVMRLIISTREPPDHSTGRVRASRIPRNLPNVACRVADPAWRAKDAAAFSPQARLVKLSAVLALTDPRRRPGRCGEAAIVRHGGSVIK